MRRGCMIVGEDRREQRPTPEKAQELLDHVVQDHAGVVDWAAMPDGRRAVFHYALPHDTATHFHVGVVYTGRS